MNKNRLREHTPDEDEKKYHTEVVHFQINHGF